MGHWAAADMPWTLPLPITSPDYPTDCYNGNANGVSLSDLESVLLPAVGSVSATCFVSTASTATNMPAIAPTAPCFFSPTVPSLHSSSAEWPAQEVLCTKEKLSPPVNRPAILSSTLLSMPEQQQLGSCALPCDIRSQQFFGGNLGGSFLSKGGSVFRQLGRPLSHQLMMNTSPLILGAVNGDIGNFTKMSPQEILDAKALAASKSHSEAERRRRERINTHLTTLRSLLPSSTKTDKASLLAEVIEHVKDLKRQAAEIAEGGPVPTDVDELRVDPEPSCRDGNLMIRASLCCEDRPDLLSDLTHTLRSLRLKTVRAEIATLGGRVKNVFVMTTGDGKDEKEESPTVNCVQEALKAVLERPGCRDLSAGSSKRQRLAAAAAAAAAQDTSTSSSHEVQDQGCLPWPLPPHTTSPSII